MGNHRKNKDRAAAPDEGASSTQASSTEEQPESAETLFLGQYQLPEEYTGLVCLSLSIAVVAGIAYLGYSLRVRNVAEFGALLHNSDPWFNYRATEYMSEHGWKAFFRWFDYMSWYPLGRPVGSTTYPGLQFTAVAIHRVLAALGVRMSLSHVCVLIPAWFSVLACLLQVLFSYEVSHSLSVSVTSTILFTVIPAHLMRSMAGEFDNECIAMAAMLLTFYLWVRSLRTRASWPIGALAGVAYGYMAAAWGGYIFVLNMVALHAGVAALVDWARNTYSPSLLRSYALFYVVGTALATRVPPVDMAPFRSLELLGGLVVLLFLCGQSVCELQRARTGVERFSRRGVAQLIRIYAAFFVAIVVAALCAPAGFIKPLSIQADKLIRNVPHTGNPLVDVMLAEDASNLLVAWRLLLFPFFGWMIGLTPFLSSMTEHYTHAKCFLLLYGVVGLYFSTCTVRMIVMVAPAACVFTAFVFQWVLNFAQAGLFWTEMPPEEERNEGDAARTEKDRPPPQTAEAQEAALRKKKEEWTSKNTKKFMVRVLPLMALLFLVRLSGFVEDVNETADQFSAPGIVFHNHPSTDWKDDTIDDYYKGFVWLREHTPEDARVLAWFDYGYQITGIGNRTSLADGNTWNYEHIATIGKMLTSPVAEAHSLVRHMADYVFIFAGDTFFSDLDRSPLLARMANSVYHDICPNDPLCRHFGFQKKQKAALKRRSRLLQHSELQAEDEAPVEYEPSPLLARSLLYHLHANGTTEGVSLDASMFQHVFTSIHGLVRIYKVMNVSRESKRWVADPANRVCNPPGSWICPGQYPPAKEIQAMLAHQHSNFQDLVDAYEEAAMEEMLDDEYARGGDDM
ncbi:putative mitochondrial oligosaccharyl transferase-like protein [Leptomonas pyrrhocoris]|uniref:dolichyl-diphosphooligosaccharide--protein glycotransferase n=1 Tax=Leptomonas pyrrhocoris TaxID=157538 RepID=A0A0N0E043_LEPPY|nr:putative mitochondrial oligosaccharyl transferase-like protein [Leptomonas pyrrhocoris]KPA86002.1 putative mitochondrial oligosaccharyl transferase-like protein [Leptomonas pyrrhocoris]|eukprot:XP_015664441.1 putative mitochondrial oligosaccharyl transferase-like protein [Leptomonas pyrrhocoris]